jgi:hypothetical protein
MKLTVPEGCPKAVFTCKVRVYSHTPSFPSYGKPPSPAALVSRIYGRDEGGGVPLAGAAKLITLDFATVAVIVPVDLPYVLSPP